MMVVASSAGQEKATAPQIAQQGWSAFEQGHLSDAKRLLAEAVERDPTKADYPAALAQVEAKMGNEAAAIVHLRKAVALSPSDAEFRLNLAQILQTENNDQEALRVLKSAQPDARLSGAWHFSRGFSLFRVGRYSEATGEFKTVLGNEALKPSALFFLGNIAYSLGEFGQAEGFLSEAVQLGNQETNKAYNAYTYDHGLALMKLEGTRMLPENLEPPSLATIAIHCPGCFWAGVKSNSATTLKRSLRLRLLFKRTSTFN